MWGEFIFLSSERSPEVTVSGWNNGSASQLVGTQHLSDFWPTIFSSLLITSQDGHQRSTYQMYFLGSKMRNG